MRAGNTAVAVIRNRRFLLSLGKPNHQKKGVTRTSGELLSQETITAVIKTELGLHVSFRLSRPSAFPREMCHASLGAPKLIVELTIMAPVCATALTHIIPLKHSPSTNTQSRH